MAIGNHKYWIIIEIAEGEPRLDALTPENDKRRALMFTSAQAAQSYIDKLEPAWIRKGMYVVGVPA